MSKDCTIQDVFHRFYPSFESTHSISPAQRKAAYHIMNCKTGAFGVNVSVCEDCGCMSVHYNSCRDRCCPMCQEFPREKWVDARREDILDAPYFHVVFTVPEELNPIIYSNQKFLYTALYHAASDTLSELAADSKYLGTDIGYICILHTWGSTMNFHPHIHAIVLGGGLDVKNHWKDNAQRSLNMSTENRIKYSTINLIRISQQMKSTGNGVRILHICSFRIMRYATTVPY